MAIRQVKDLEELREVVKPVTKRGIQEVVVHHSWSPTAAQYKGKATWAAIRNYHMQERAWSDIGYHFGIGPDESIWMLRDYRRSGAHVLNRNAHTIGVAMVGNFDVEDPMANGLPVAAQVVRVLVDRFKLKPEHIRFHREFADKTCPGTRIALAAFRKLVMGTTATVPTPAPAKPMAIKVIHHPSGEVIETLQMVPGGNHIGDQGKIYVVR